jgi:hypothetical protein
LGRVALPNALGRKYPNGIRLQPICLRMDMTSAPFRNSSATAMSARPSMRNSSASSRRSFSRVMLP